MDARQGCPTRKDSGGCTSHDPEAVDARALAPVTGPGSAPLHGRVWVVAHRGASHDAPEHTHAAYERALSEGADFLEADLWPSRDGSLVCVHDMTVDRTSNGAGRVSDLTVEQLKSLDFGSWFNAGRPDRSSPGYAALRVVLFDEMLDRYSGTRPNGQAVRFHVETKYPYEAAVDPALIDGSVEDQIVRAIAGRHLIQRGQVVVQSFWPRSLRIVSDISEGAVPTALLSPGPGPEALPPGVTISAPRALELAADPGYVSRMHAIGHEVHTWTVDEPQMMRDLIAAGVDGIFTNRPGVLRRLLEKEFPEWSAYPAPPATRPSP